MKFLAVLALACVSAVYAIPSGEKEKYTVKYDNIDVNEIIRSDRLTENYYDCLRGTKPCTPDGEELKKNLPDALENDCAKCSEKQKEGSKIVIQHLYKNKRQWFDILAAKYDPTGKYVKAHKAELDAL